MEALCKKEKRLMDMDNSVVMGGIRELNGSVEKYNKNKQIKLTI